MLTVSKVSQLARNSPQLMPLRELNTQRWYQPLGHDTGIKLYNCITRQNEPLILPNENVATWYTCGPTVYDAAHIGHASCYVKLDIIQRILRHHFGINLVTAMNITDIDDKVIAKSHETGKYWREITKAYELQFWSDMKILNVAEPNVKIRVTENIPKIIAFIESIMKKNNAYVGKDKSVYFEVRKFPCYGKLQRVNLDESNNATEIESKETVAESNQTDSEIEVTKDPRLVDKARIIKTQSTVPKEHTKPTQNTSNLGATESEVCIDVTADPRLRDKAVSVKKSSTVQVVPDKASPHDFALWKAQKSPSEPYWDSPWGPGRPGWHIECSVLASMIFGDNIDFHAGGLDLRFPHHENEEAQSCVFHDTRQWVNYWIHTGQLKKKGQAVKMSKSLKNTISIKDMLTKHTSDDFRMACVLSNYRKSVEYSDEVLHNASNSIAKFKSFKLDCQAYLNGQKRGGAFDSNEIFRQIKESSVKIDEYFKNDFDTAHSIGVLSELISYVSSCLNSNQSYRTISTSSMDVVAAVDNFVERNLQNFGFQFSEAAAAFESSSIEIELNALLDDLLKTRKDIRERAMFMKNKELFKICDDLRKCLEQHGIEVRDHNKGSSWSFNKKLN